VRIVKYFFVGGAAAAVDLTVFTVFVKLLGYNYLAVSVCGFTIATPVNYLFGIKFVFRRGARFSTRHEVALLYLVSATGLAFNTGLLFAFVEYLRLDSLIAKILATLGTFLWNYTLRQRFVFREARRA
jgi:putative flippase GtrA